MREVDRKKIEENIKKGLVTTVVRLPWVDPENPRTGDCTDQPGEYFTDVDDLIVYTVGNHSKGHAEILAFGGPLPGEMPLTRSQLYERAKELEQFCAVISGRVGDSGMFPRGRCYASSLCNGWVIHENELIPVPIELKTDYMDLASQFYGTTDFEVESVTPAPPPPTPGTIPPSQQTVH